MNAGATRTDEAALRDGNLVWGRVVADIPDFTTASSSPPSPNSRGEAARQQPHQWERRGRSKATGARDFTVVNTRL